jgi:dihydrolipoamide dehydrogenase
MSVTLVERENLGGVCANRGCIPTKSLLHLADTRRAVLEAGDYGVPLEQTGFDFALVVRRAQRSARVASGGVKQLLKSAGVEVMAGSARLLGGLVVELQGTEGNGELRADKAVLLATGSRPRTLAGLEPDGSLLWSVEDAWTAASLPASLLVVGSGAVGMEFASFYADMGSSVTVVELEERLLPGEDEEISELARLAFKKRGLEVHCGTHVQSLDKNDDGLVFELAGESAGSVSVERALVAVGVTGNIDELGLENTEVKLDGGFVVTNEWGGTGEQGVYAIGDLVGPPCLAHKAAQEGRACVEHIAGLPGARPVDHERIPSCVYTHPEIASVGLSEVSARERGHELSIGRSFFTANGKATAIGQREGLVKTVFDAASGRLLGAHMIGPGVTELVGNLVLLQAMDGTAEDLARAVFPHPTLSEALGASAQNALEAGAGG